MYTKELIKNLVVNFLRDNIEYKVYVLSTLNLNVSNMCFINGSRFKRLDLIGHFTFLNNIRGFYTVENISVLLINLFLLTCLPLKNFCDALVVV